MQNSTESTFAEWVIKNRNAFFIVLGIIVLGASTLAITQSVSKKRTLAATAALHSASEELTQELKAAGTTPVTDVDRQLSKTVAALQKVSSQFSRTHTAWEALFQLADLYLKYETRSGKAVKAFETAATASPTTREKVFSLYSLAYAHEGQGNFNEAIQSLDQAIALKQPYLKGEISLSRARLLARAGRADEARKAFEQVSKDFANTDFARKAEQWKSMGAI